MNYQILLHAEYQQDRICIFLTWQGKAAVEYKNDKSH